MGRSSHRRLLAPVCVVALLAAACAASVQETTGHHSRLFNTTVQLHDHLLTLHMSEGYGAKGPLLVYLTGDGGWFGKDEEVFNKLVPSGYPIAGVSAREYVNHLGDGVKVELPTHLADDISGIVAAADEALNLPLDGRVVLVGKSRGAGLAVAAAWPESRLRPRLQGILAIALTREEEYVYVPVTGQPEGSPVGMFQPYDALPDMPNLRIAVLQSSNDNYIPGPQAREYFGPDGPTRRFRSIEADDHGFGGGLLDLYAELAASLEWIVSPGPTS